MKKLLFSVAFIATSFFTTAQVGIGTTSIDASALLELDATDKALLLPRVTSTSAVTTAVNGMLVYDVSADCVKGYENGAWTQCLGTATILTPSATVLAQIGTEANTGATSVVTVAQINMISPPITGAVAANEAAYQAYIDANPGSFASPATQPEVQAMITAVNSATVLAQIGLEADVAATVPSVVTVAQINMISPAITGALMANEAAYQAYIDANPGSFSSPATAAEVQAMITAVNAVEAIQTVTGAAGRIWMDRNLGANQVATYSEDYASYGDFYQWGRPADGHQSITRIDSNDSTENSANNPTLATSSPPGHGDFITPAIFVAPEDWLATPDPLLWNSGTEAAPVKTTNDPCPSGFRVPTQTEFDAEFALFSPQDDAGAFASPLKLPVAGNRFSSGASDNEGWFGDYWTSTAVVSSESYFIGFYSGGLYGGGAIRAYGASVRCIQE